MAKIGRRCKMVFRATRVAHILESELGLIPGATHLKQSGAAAITVTDGENSRYL